MTKTHLQGECSRPHSIQRANQMRPITIQTDHKHQTTRHTPGPKKPSGFSRRNSLPFLCESHQNPGSDARRRSTPPPSEFHVEFQPGHIEELTEMNAAIFATCVSLETQRSIKKALFDIKRTQRSRRTLSYLRLQLLLVRYHLASFLRLAIKLTGRDFITYMAKTMARPLSCFSLGAFRRIK